MRTIKFRAWDGEKMIEEPTFEVSNGVPDDGEWILMQYTGLKDKNGKEVYEGDIVKFIEYTGEEYAGEVKYEAPRFVFAGLHNDYLDYVPNGVAKDFEVIGNIYENS